MALWKVYMCVAVFGVIDVSAMSVSLSRVGKAVRGSNITFTATVAGYEDPNQELKFIFHDNAIPHNEYTLVTTRLLLNYKRGNTLNGKIKLSQNNTDRYNYVAVNKNVQHTIQLPDNELKFIQGNSSEIITYWFIDCMLIEPISMVNITGLNWLQHGDLLDLKVMYTGSPPFDYCYLYKIGQYNVTGNETCPVKSRTTSNVFPIIHYFSDSDQHTVVVVIENDIGKSVSRVTVMYTGSPPFDYCYLYKIGQYNVTGNETCPVKSRTTSNVFPIIHYFSDSDQHTVVVVIENDIGKSAHPDYKTFRERLRDSFRNAFHFGARDDTDPLTASRYDSTS
ncbi:Uncharacterized protein OBRU01_20873 [Operophtera brumata]|uniref:Uncharacterized protein n=1 Tax=Operophtera brumata TaxID=104452 RepID=A0A0L7KTY2_OPEBR|nr:Uncharacterized protein OBRU01_20873 [Operophtera brumata]